MDLVAVGAGAFVIGLGLGVMIRRYVDRVLLGSE